MGHGLFYPVVGFASCVVFFYMSLGNFQPQYVKSPEFGFVGRNGTQFMLDGKAFYVNGWNSYWLMDQAVEEYSRPRVRAMLQAGAKMGLTVCRTWAFNDGGYNALQISPGRFDERVFKALDRVIAEARKHGIRLLLPHASWQNTHTVMTVRGMVHTVHKQSNVPRTPIESRPPCSFSSCWCFSRLYLSQSFRHCSCCFFENPSWCWH